MVPGYVAVDGCGDAFIYEAELCVVMDELILAGQHQSFAALGFCIGDGALDEVSGIAMFAVLRDGVDAEDHLPGTGFLVELGALIHFIGQVSCIGNHAVYKSNELTFIKHEPEMITVMGKAVFKIGTGSGLRRREAFCFDSGDSIKVFDGCGSD